MLYNLFEYLNETYNFPGAGVFQYISFRAAMALITSLIVSLLFGGKIIKFIRNKQIGEEVRELGLKGEEGKQGTPTMGGLIIISSIIIPTLLFAKLDNIYVIILLVSTIWLGLIGFLDDFELEVETASIVNLKGVPFDELQGDVVISLGGDGTLLYILSKLNKPIFGINCGGVGFWLR